MWKAKAVKHITHRTEQDFFDPEFSDEDLEIVAGDPRCFPTFTCGMPMCGTGGSCGTFQGDNGMPSSGIKSEEFVVVAVAKRT
jgi:hypothetical protein